MTAKTAEEKSLVDTRNEANGYVLEEIDLANVTTPEEAFALLAENGIEIESAEEFGAGFEVLNGDEKDRLIGQEMLLMEWRFNKSREYGGDYVMVRIMTREGKKYLISDGGEGICKQLRLITDRRIMNGRANPQSGITVQKGLRRSDYKVPSVNPKTNEEIEIEASTYYLAI